MSFAWQVHDSTGVREYLIVELPPKFPVLDYEDKERRERLEDLQRKRKWQVLVVGTLAFVAVLCVLFGRGWSW